jgi:hypothetical protein
MSQCNSMELLLKYAMGVEKELHFILHEVMDLPNPFAYSFCKDEWVPHHHTVRYERCDVCYDLAWHCEMCSTCKARRKLACDGCGGWPEDGIWNDEDGPKST